jgi:hypothetical protein
MFSARSTRAPTRRAANRRRCRDRRVLPCL